MTRSEDVHTAIVAITDLGGALPGHTRRKIATQVLAAVLPDQRSIAQALDDDTAKVCLHCGTQLLPGACPSCGITNGVDPSQIAAGEGASIGNDEGVLTTTHHPSPGVPELADTAVVDRECHRIEMRRMYAVIRHLIDTGNEIGNNASWAESEDGFDPTDPIELTALIRDFSEVTVEWNPAWNGPSEDVLDLPRSQP